MRKLLLMAMIAMVALAGKAQTASRARSKAALIKNDILDNRAGDISFQDPIYAYWLKTEYFAK